MGYRCDEFDSPLPNVQKGLRIRLNAAIRHKRQQRMPMMSSIGASDRIAVMPHADLDHAKTYLAGVIKRTHQDKFRPTQTLTRAMRRKAEKWAKQFPQLAHDYDMSVVRWLTESSYPQWRKDELLGIYLQSLDPEFVWPTEVSAFSKDEQYPSMKHARGINARHDAWKVRLGPFMHAIEKVIFSHPDFVKRVPLEHRFKYLATKLNREGRGVQWTDHSAYESVFTNDIVESIIIPLYCHVLADHPELPSFIAMYRKVVLPRVGHILRSKFMTISGGQSEFSGEMDTSLKNGTGNKFSAELANALSESADQAAEFVAWCLTSDDEMVKRIDDCEMEQSTAPMADHEVLELQHNAVYEGDDGVVSARVATDGGAFTRIGFTVKMVSGETVQDGDFCSVDGDLRTNAAVTDPIKVLGNFGWFGQSHVTARRGRKLELLRAKAASLISMYPDAPILGAFARYVLRVTKHIDMSRFLRSERGVCRYYMDEYILSLKGLDAKAAAVPNVRPESRAVAESRYGILVKHQLEIEQYFDTLHTLTFIDCSALRLYWPNDWVDYASRYTVQNRDIDDWQPVLPALYDNFTPSLKKQLLAAGLDVDRL